MRFLFSQIFFSPQVMRCAVITYKRGIYELPDKLPNNLRDSILGNIRKVLKIHRIIVIGHCRVFVPKRTLSKLPKNYWKFHMKTKVWLKYFVSDCRYQIPLYLWWIEPVLKCCKVPKYYDQHCLKTFLLASTLSKILIWLKKDNSIQTKTKNKQRWKLS